MWRVVAAGWICLAAGWICLTTGCGRFRFDSAEDAEPGGPDAAPLDPRLVFHLDFEGSEPLRDKARNHVTRCETECPAIVTGAPRGSSAATFVNLPGCVHVTDDLDLQSPTFTYAVWFRPLSTTNQTFLSRPYESETGSRNTFELVVDQDPDPAKVIVTTLIYGDRHARSLTLDEWHHAAGSYDGQTMRVYYDGVLVFGITVDPLPLPLTENEPLVGCDRDKAVDYAFYRGELDDVRIYSAALSDAEIAALATPAPAGP